VIGFQRLTVMLLCNVIVIASPRLFYRVIMDEDKLM